MLKICITGHRDLMNTEDVRMKIAYSLKYFKTTSDELEAISAVAAGADMIFAEEAIKQQIPLRIVLPFDLHEYLKDFNKADAENLKEILRGRVPEISQHLNDDKKETREEAYFATGKKMVDDSDIVLTVWDGKPAGGRGGTGEIVEYAKSIGKELHIIRGIRAPKPDDLAQANEAQIAFDELDKEAVKYKKYRFEPAWIAGITSGLLAVFSFAYRLEFGSPNLKFIFSCCEVIFFIISFVLLAVYAKKWKNIFLRKRRDAEYLRTVLWFKEAGLPVPAIEQTEFKPTEEILNIAKRVGEGLSKIENVPNARRIAWCLVQEQIDYHQQTRIVPFTEKRKKMGLWLDGIKIVFFALALMHFLFELMEYCGKTYFRVELFKPYLLFLLLILPSVYAALEGIKYFGEWKRNIAVSKKTVSDLKKINEKILAWKDEQSILPEAKILRNILEIENNDWAERYDEKEVEAKL